MYFQFINFNSISSSGIWIELQFQFWDWIDPNPTCNGLALNKSLPKPMVTRLCRYMVSPGLSNSWSTFCACRSRETVKSRGFNLQCINLVVVACTKLETSRYLNQWLPEFCQYIESLGLNAGPVNHGDSPVLTVDILRPMLSAQPLWTISAYGVQWWIVHKNNSQI